jgi:hypothetical protein
MVTICPPLWLTLFWPTLQTTWGNAILWQSWRRIDLMHAQTQRYRSRHQAKWLLGFAAMQCVLVASPAAAQEACIVCTGPEQTYLCSVEKSDKIRKFAAAADKAIQFACIKEMAKIGGHQTCRARRDAATSSADLALCDGLPQTVLLGSLLEAAELETAAQIAVTPPAAKVVPQKLPPGSSPPDAPKTVVEMARRANEQSAAQLRQAGEQVGTVVEKTWTCMTSLFQRC